MDVNTVVIPTIIGLVVVLTFMLRNAATAQAMINVRFDKVDKAADELRVENADLRSKLAGLTAANEIMTVNQTTERTLSDNRAEKYGELQERVRVLTVEKDASQGESRGWQKVAEDLRVLVDGYPLQVKTLEAIARRLGAEASPATSASVEKEIADAKPDAALYPPPAALPVQHVVIDGQTKPVEVIPAASDTDEHARANVNQNAILEQRLAERGSPPPDADEPAT